MKSQKTLTIPSMWQRRNIERNIEICRLYDLGKFTTAHIARRFGLSTRIVQRMVGQAGLARTIAESNVVLASLKSKHRVRQSG